MKTQLTYLQNNVKAMLPGLYAVYSGRCFIGFVVVENGKAVGVE